MAASFKICPICGTRTHANAVMCSTCGTSLADIAPVKGTAATLRTPSSTYDRRYGETDLLEGETPRNSGMLLIGGLLVLPLILCAGLIGFLGARSLAERMPTEVPPTVTITQTAQIGESIEIVPTDTPLPLFTNTPYPTPRLATITPAPPTATATFTPGPCERRVEAGQTLIDLAYSCGHRSQDVFPEILEMNNLSAPEALIAGQLIQIPWPTPTVDPNASGAADNEIEVADAGNASSGDVETVLAAQVFEEVLPTPTDTLIPGVMWHIIQTNETMVGIAYLYNTNAEVLAQLNPEIDFLQCDFGLDTGGETCTVFLVAGQQMRVPAPTATPTLSPTPSGSETATPTATATFNAPSLMSPSNRALFMRADLITLRWVPTGTLALDEQYLVTLRDLTANRTETALTTQLFYIVPSTMQGTDARRHEYEWMVSVVRNGDPASARFTTDPRTFTWEALGDPTPTGEMTNP